MAGNVTMRALAAKPDIPAIVIWAGAVYTYSDMRQFQIDDNSYRPPPSNAPSRQERQRLFEIHGNFDPNSPFWKQVAATNYLSEIQGAIQIHHAVNDDVVNIGYSRNLISLLSKTSVEHELYEYPSGGHNITGSSFNQAMQRTVDFYKTHLAN
jgi:dipeptidyl aminopeptidase/acylaminoacyl peptidase